MLKKGIGVVVRLVGKELALNKRLPPGVVSRSTLKLNFAFLSGLAGSFQPSLETQLRRFNCPAFRSQHRLLPFGEAT